MPETSTAVRPCVVVLCGSTRFFDAFQAANYAETMAGKIVLSVGFYPHATAEHGHGEGVGHNSAEKVALDELHKRKIDWADEVLVLDVEGYIGASTRSEIDYAVQHGKSIRYLSREPGLIPSQPHSTPAMSIGSDQVNAGGDQRRALIVATRGLPGSGKTTWAKAEMARLRAVGIRAARISRDDVRASLGLVPGRTTAATEAEVTAIQHRFIASALAAGVAVVLVDDTNLDEAHITALADLAAEVGAGLEVQDLRDVPLATCIERDAARTGTAHLGADRIRSIAASASLPSITADQVSEWLADGPGAEHGQEPGTDEGYSHLLVYDEKTWDALAAYLADRVNTALDVPVEEAETTRVLFRDGEELADAFTGAHTESPWLLVSRQGRVWSLYVSVDDEFYLRAIVDRFDIEGISVGEPRIAAFEVEDLPAWEWPLALVDDAVSGAVVAARRDWLARVEGLPRETVAAQMAHRIDDDALPDGEAEI